VSYLVLARKYRPQTFEDLAGQDHVARTLANAIATGRIAHAFLFTGVRGVGKTTSARLLAKCLECVGADGRATGPTATPCNVCAPCTEITAGQDMDVQEIDGASYNGVDEVRRLQEGMTFRPARDRFKIYIVDEVHMLSTAAWNAFLKTLEEPPPHVKFVFATTEVHKVPVTILSRCQRYDFKLIPTQTIARRLEQVLAQENISADGAAVQVLAREAAGSMRDAMSLVDQVIAFSGSKLTGDDVARVLGVADRKILHELAAALVTGDAAGCLSVVDRLAAQGFDVAQVTKDILRHLRNLVVAKVCASGTPGAGSARRGAQSQAPEGPGLRELLDLADEEMKDVVELAAGAGADDLSRLFQGFSRTFDEIARSSQPRMVLEMALVRLARRPPLLPLDELLQRVGELERRLGGAPPQTSPPRGGGGGSTRSQGAHASGPNPPGPAQALTLPSAGPARSQRADPNENAGAARSQRADPNENAGAARSQRADPNENAPSGNSASTQAAHATHGSLALKVADPSPAARATPLAPAPEPSPEKNVSGAAPTTPAGAGAPDLVAWRAILERLRATRPALASVFEHAFVLETSASRFVVAFDASAVFLAARATEPEALEALTREVRAHFGAPTEVVAVRSTKDTGGVKTVAAMDAERRAAELAQARAAVQDHPLVQEAVRIFGAQLREVRLPRGEG
jgi:DNA polymerase-3 subunit gamma/tau